MSNSNQQRLDGVSVESHAGRFSGEFDLDEEVVGDLGFGEVVYALVVANIAPPVFKTDKNGDLKRVEVFASEDVRIVSREVWEEVLDIVEAADPQQRLFSRTQPDYSRVQATNGLGDVSEVDLTGASARQSPTHVVDEPVVDEETGEILSAGPEDRPVPAHVLERRRRTENTGDEAAVVPVGTRVAGGPARANNDPVLQAFLEQGHG